MHSSGQQVNIIPVPHVFPLDDLEKEYITADTSADSRPVWVKNDAQGAFYIDIESTGTPTEIIFYAEFSVDGTNWYEKADTYWANFVFDDTVVADGVKRRYSIDLRDATAWFRIRVKANGVGATGTTSFTINNAFLELLSR